MDTHVTAEGKAGFQEEAMLNQPAKPTKIEMQLENEGMSQSVNPYRGSDEPVGGKAIESDVGQRTAVVAIPVSHAGSGPVTHGGKQHIGLSEEKLAVGWEEEEPGKKHLTVEPVRCLVCGDKSSGLHYGVLACEGCKGFFRRALQDVGDPARKKCYYDKNCDVNALTRNRCQFCRLQKCLKLGMSRSAAKLGRRSRQMKEQIAEACKTIEDSHTAQALHGLLSLNKGQTSNTKPKAVQSPAISVNESPVMTELIAEGSVAAGQAVFPKLTSTVESSSSTPAGLGDSGRPVTVVTPSDGGQIFELLKKIQACGSAALVSHQSGAALVSHQSGAALVSHQSGAALVSNPSGITANLTQAVTLKGHMSEGQKEGLILSSYRPRASPPSPSSTAMSQLNDLKPTPPEADVAEVQLQFNLEKARESGFSNLKPKARAGMKPMQSSKPRLIKQKQPNYASTSLLKIAAGGGSGDGELGPACGGGLPSTSDSTGNSADSSSNHTGITKLILLNTGGKLPQQAIIATSSGESRYVDLSQVQILNATSSGPVSPATPHDIGNSSINNQHIHQITKRAASRPAALLIARECSSSVADNSVFTEASPKEGETSVKLSSDMDTSQGTKRTTASAVGNEFDSCRSPLKKRPYRPSNASTPAASYSIAEGEGGSVGVKYTVIPQPTTAAAQELASSTIASSERSGFSLEVVDGQPLNMEELASTVYEAFMETIGVTYSNVQEKRESAIGKLAVSGGPSAASTNVDNSGANVPELYVGLSEEEARLCWCRYEEQFNAAIADVVNFAKRIPGFSALETDDQIILIKGGSFEVACVMQAAFIWADQNVILFSSSDFAYTRSQLKTSFFMGPHFIDLMFNFASRFANFNLTDVETAIFCALMLIRTDRSGLINPDKVNKLQEILIQALQEQVEMTHSSTGSQGNDQGRVFPRLLMAMSDLRELNGEQRRALTASKGQIQFTEGLLAEIFDLL